MPTAIANAPEVHTGLELYYSAFLDLSSCRGQGFSEGPINWLAIHDYARVNEFSNEQREDLFYFVHYLDKAYLEYKAKKIGNGVGTKKGIEQKGDG